MGLNEVVSAERVHIGFFGMRNAGKSSVVNAVTGQDLSVVSEVKGTTTDPVKKAMELLPIGPVVIIDTPGLDDEGTLGELRVKKAREILNQTDIAVLIVDVTKGLSEEDSELVELFKERKTPYLVVYNKSDLQEKSTTDVAEKGESENASVEADANTKNIYVSALTGEGIYELKEALGDFARANKKEEKFVVVDLLKEGDLVVLVIPVDESAPKGRLILPQQLVMRELLDHHYAFVSCQDTDLKETLCKLKDKPALVITDSQAFEKVSKDTPNDIMLTSFSILMARYKGGLKTQINGAKKLSSLQEGDTVLISEGCTHHRQCKDIGTVKMPGWIEGFTGKKLNYRFTSGGEFPEDLSGISLVVHCGGCMLNEAQMKSRVQRAVKQGIPIVNYGIAIACMHGILDRSLEIIPQEKE
ncbi:MAG: [Lachnospiraceae bacterium]|nr:[FeFe] hydrogenase H-cluster maturation GTPase HydF [Lachnospiraceae bacterium]